MIGTKVFATAFFVILLFVGKPVVDAGQPALPALFDTTYTAPRGSVITVPDGGDFQAALNKAKPGDTITLTGTVIGNFVLPDKGGNPNAYIVVRPVVFLTPEGVRVTPAQLAGFPKIVSPNTAPAIQAAPGAHRYRFINCDIRSGVTAVNGYLVGLGTGSETNANDFPHHIIIDRCGVRGDPINGGRRGVMFAGNYQAVIDSYLSDWKEVGADTQAIAGWTGYGPYKIVNNYLEGAGENVLFGGADTAIANLIPSDIEIRGNLFYKPLTWKIGDQSYLGTPWTIKNLLELKHAQRVLITDNIFENCWEHAQGGFAIVFTPQNQQGSNPWAVVNDITFMLNTVRNVTCGMNIAGHDTVGNASPFSQQMLVQRNLFYDIDSKLFIISNGYNSLTINHNTASSSPIATIVADSTPMTEFKFTNNIVVHGLYGVVGTDHASGNDAINFYFPGADFRKNVMVANSGTAPYYPADNFFPPILESVGFVNLTNNADLRLAPASAYSNAALDGTDIGADLLTPQ